MGKTEKIPIVFSIWIPIFLLIIIGFSIVGILRTFESDLLNYLSDFEN